MRVNRKQPFNFLIRILRKLIGGDHQRTLTANKNSIGNLLVKGTSMVIGFVSVRLYLNYLGTEHYGVWLTISSFYAWFTFFEFGLGNGLRNKLAQALAKNDTGLAKIYISTTYFLMSLIVILLILVFLLINKSLNWNVILNTQTLKADVLRKATGVIFILFFALFFIKLISSVLLALQKTTLSYAIQPISNVISYFIILGLYKSNIDASLIKLGIVIAGTPVIVSLLLSIYFFRTSLKALSPSFKSIRLVHSKELLGIGIYFFLIQISGLIMYQSSNFIIAQLLGNEDVVLYNVALKLVSLLQMIFALIIAPLWSAFTEAWEKNDLMWIKSTIKRSTQTLMFLTLLFSVVLIFHKPIIAIWLEEQIVVPTILIIALFVHFFLKSFGGIFVSFLNGISNLKPQLIFSLIGSVMFIPLTYFLMQYLHLGLVGLVVSIIISNFYGPFIAPFQAIGIIKRGKKQ